MFSKDKVSDHVASPTKRTALLLYLIIIYCFVLHSTVEIMQILLSTVGQVLF